MANKPGKGKKLCKTCKTICAAAARKCTNPDCNLSFSSPEKIELKQLKKDKDISNKNKKVIVPEQYNGYRIISSIYVPAGKPPLELKKNPSRDDVINWSENIRLHFLEKEKVWMLNHAITYYLRYYYDTFDKKSRLEYDRCAKIIDELQDIKIETKVEPEIV